MAGEGPGGIDVAWSRRRGRADPRHRGGDRAASRRAGGRVSPDDAAEHFAWPAGFLAADSPASSALTRELVGWQPTHLGLIDDLDKGHHFHKPSA
jgi:hypothetical protein